jgi:hypothetical protein
MAGIDELISTFMGQTQQGLNAPAAPWQQELLETVNPEKVKRQNIARALAQASTAMATTPGNFLSGISAAAATGANSYLTSRDQAEAERAKVQQLVQMSQQKDQDRRLGLLMDAIGVTQKGIAEKRAAESHTVGLDRERATTDYYKRRGTDEDGLNANQTRNAKQSIINGVERLDKRLSDVNSPDYVDDPNERNRRLLQEQDKLERIFGVRLMDEDAAEVPGRTDLPKNGGTSPQVPSAEAAQGSITQGPGGIGEGTTIVNRQTGQRMILKDGKWQPL